MNTSRNSCQDHIKMDPGPKPGFSDCLYSDVKISDSLGYRWPSCLGICTLSVAKEYQGQQLSGISPSSRVEMRSIEGPE